MYRNFILLYYYKLNLKKYYQCNFCGFFLITTLFPVLGHHPSPSSGPGPNIVPVHSPGPVIFLALVLVPFPVPACFWSQPWSQSRSKFLFPSHSGLSPGSEASACNSYKMYLIDGVNTYKCL